ncbi:hypothetical protein VIGAN_02325200, partial [Vigna angularis var. angularis]
KLFMDLYVCVTFMLIFYIILVLLILSSWRKNLPQGNWKVMKFFLYVEQTSLFRQSRMLCSHMDRTKQEVEIGTP